MIAFDIRVGAVDVEVGGGGVREPNSQGAREPKWGVPVPRTKLNRGGDRLKTAGAGRLRVAAERRRPGKVGGGIVDGAGNADRFILVCCHGGRRRLFSAFILCWGLWRGCRVGVA